MDDKMQTFTFKALGADGKEKSGKVDADGRQDAIKKI